MKLNIDGKTEIGSYTGSFVSVCLLIVLFFYGLKRFQTWVYVTNPSVELATYQNFYEPKYEVNLTDIGFKIAFGVNDYKSGKPLDDPNFV